jgi:hypothetical protein
MICKKVPAGRQADAWLLFCSDFADDSEVSKIKRESGMKSGPVHDTGIYHRLMNPVKKTFNVIARAENWAAIAPAKTKPRNDGK